jgi:hypothetical protein
MLLFGQMEQSKFALESEKKVIKLMDDFKDPMKKISIPQDEAQQIDILNQPTLQKQSRKTKIFQLIENDPDYLPKKRVSMNKRTTVVCIGDDDDDEDYE